MKPPTFDYLRAESTQHTLGALAHTGEDARVLTRNQSLMVVLSMRLTQLQLLVDISRTHDLNAVRIEDGYLEVSAAATQGNVEWHPSLANGVPLLTLAFPHVSHFRIHDRGTVCGSITRADPDVKLPLVLTTLDEQVVLHSLRRRRVMQATSFFQGMLVTAHKPDELVEAVRFPLRQPGARYGFTEFSARHDDFALVACTTIVADDTIALVVGGVADRPVLERWPRLQDKALIEVVNDSSWRLGAQGDAHVSAQYRRHLVRQLGMRAIEEAR